MGRNLLLASVCVATAACTTTSGRLDLALSLPPSGDLRPTGMTQVSVTTEAVGGTPSVLTTALAMSGTGSSTFSAGEVQAGVPITLKVELRDPTNKLVGFGAIADPVTPSATDDKAVTITVRKPIVYVPGDRPVHTLDPTLDALDPKYQNSLSASAVVVTPVDGTTMALVGAGSVQLMTTADHKPTGNAITIPGGGATDAATVPGKRQIVVAAQNGLVLVDVDTGNTTPIALSPRPDRVAIGGTAATGFVAYALQNRVTPPMGSGSCTGASMVIEIPLPGTNEQNMTISSGVPLADIAASADGVFGANPCAGTVTRLDPGAPKIMMQLPGAAQVAIASNRLWGAGSMPPQTVPDPVGARVELASVLLDGSDQRMVNLPPKVEVVIYDMDQANELSLSLHADTYVPLDMAVLPGDQYVALIAQMNAHRAARYDGFGKVIPEMTAMVSDVILADVQTGAISQRVRATCKVQVINGSDAQFPGWICATANASETPAGGEFTPSAIDAVYGAR